MANYDVIVVGAGHAGCEAARACARLGLKTAMVTMNLDLIAQMSCNPALGGIAKGTPGREIQPLGGHLGADALVVTTGTFLNGLAHVGEQSFTWRRSGEASSNLLGEELRNLGLE